ncbi:MAG: methyltransferase domain-containing protein [Planctomycetota bacterium]
MSAADLYQRGWWAREARVRPAEHAVSRVYAEGKVEFLDRSIDLPAGSLVLDVGTGNGAMFPALGRRHRVVGIDTSAEMLRRHVEPLRVGQASVLDLPFRDRSFDLVVCSCLLHHVRDRIRAVSEMARVSRGAVYLIEPNRWNPLQSLFSLLVPAERGGLDFDQAYLRTLLEGAGMRVAASAAWGMTFPNKLPSALAAVARLLERPMPMGNVCLSIGVHLEGGFR